MSSSFIWDGSSDIIENMTIEPYPSFLSPGLYLQIVNWKSNWYLLAKMSGLNK